MIASVFQVVVGALFILDAMVRLKNIAKKLPIPPPPVPSDMSYRVNMHVNMVIGLGLLACALFHD